MPHPSPISKSSKHILRKKAFLKTFLVKMIQSSAKTKLKNISEKKLWNGTLKKNTSVDKI